jgi:hypothetical protein
MVLGDEFADGTFRSLSRSNQTLNAGQGVYYLNGMIEEVPGTRLQQFNRSPQTEPMAGEQHADFIEVAVPLAALGNLRAGETICVAAVVARGEWNAETHVRWIDSGGLASRRTGNGLSEVVIGAVEVRLAPDPDPDGDGLTTEEEEWLGTDPNLADTDSDGLPDGWEVAHELDPLSADGMNGADGDADGDGMTHREEWLAGTNPQDADSVLTLRVTLESTNRIELSWPAVVGRRYTVEATEGNLAEFVALELMPRTAESTNETLVEEMRLNEPVTRGRVYRIRLAP